MHTFTRSLYRLSCILLLAVLLAGQGGAALGKAAAPAAVPAADLPPALLADLPPPAPATVTACTSPTNRIEFGGQDEILIANDSNAQNYYLTSSSQWQTSHWGGMGGNVNAFIALARSGMIEYFTQQGGRLYHQWSHPDWQGIWQRGYFDLNVGALTGSGGTGYLAVGRPTAVALSSTRMMVITRVSNNTLWYRTWESSTGDEAGGWKDTKWQQIPSAVAASNPEAVSRDANHVAVFYKDAGGQTYVTEQSYGEWTTRPAGLGRVLLSDLTAVSRNPNHLAVFGVGSDNRLWAREWTADKKPDWSDAADWYDATAMIPYGVARMKPAVTVAGGRIHAAVDASNVGYEWLQQTYDAKGQPTGWTAAFLYNGGLGKLTIAPLDGKAVLIASVKSDGSAWGYASTAGQWVGLGSGFEYSDAKPPVLVGWSPGEAALLVGKSNNELWGQSYTRYSRDPLKTNVNFSPPPNLEPKKGLALAKSDGNAYVGWLARYNSNAYLEWSKADGPRGQAYGYWLGSPATQMLVSADLDGTGNQKFIVVYQNASNELWVRVHRPTEQGTWTDPLQVATAGTLQDVAIGDFDGDGVRNELAIATLSGNTVDIGMVQYDYKASRRLVDLPDPHYSYALSNYSRGIALAFGRFWNSGSPADQLVVVSGNYCRHCADFRRIYGFSWSGSVGSRALTVQREYVDRPYDTFIKDIVAADLNGDGLDEAAIITNDWVEAWNLAETQVKWNPGAWAGTSVQAGDLDQDGKAELVTVRDNRVRVIKQQSGQPVGALREIYVATNVDTAGRPFLVGDVNNDSIKLVSDGCEDFNETRLVAVLYSPPRWGGSNSAQQAAFTYGKSRSSGTVSANTTSNKVGGFLSVGFTIEQAIPIVGTKIAEVRGSVTQDFASTRSESLETGNTTTQSNSVWGVNSDAQVVIETSSYRCQYYRRSDESEGTRSIKACANKSTPAFNSYTLEDWNDRSAPESPGNAPYWVDLAKQTGANGLTHSSSIEDYYSRLGGDAFPTQHSPILYKLDTCGSCNIIRSSNSVAFSLENTIDNSKTKAQSWETNTTASLGVTAGVVTIDAGFTFGFGGESSYTVSWGQGWNFETGLGNIPTSAPASQRGYRFTPYLYQATAVTKAGASYPYMVLDYTYTPNAYDENAPQPAAAPQTPPQTPELTSPSHPDPLTWYPSSTVAWQWQQPAGDPATIAGYDWSFDQTEVYTPTGTTGVFSTTTTYTNLRDGVWFMHLRAIGDAGELSQVARRSLRVDTHAPQVQIGAPAPEAGDGWHNQPFTVTLSADDAAGSGVAGIQYQLDSGGWQPYTTPLVFATDIPTTTLWARATDNIGQVSTPVSTTLKLDTTPPTSLDADGYRISYAGQTVTPTGNQWMKLGGQLDDGLSGRSSMLITDQAGLYHPVDTVGLFPMPPGNLFPTSETTLNWVYTPTFSVHGTYPIFGYGVDQAANHEAVNPLGTFTWFPTGQPDFSQTLVSVQPDPAYPGDVLDFTVAVRNSGALEANLLLTETLPAGLSVLPDTISHGGQYLAGSNAIAWEIKPVWPGQPRYLTFSATVTASPASPTILQHSLALKPYWPDIYGIISQPATSQVNGQLTILPAALQAARRSAVPEATTSLTPELRLGQVFQGDLVSDPNVWVYLAASPDTQSVLVREFNLNPATAQWELAQQSGWMKFEDGDHFFNVQTGDTESSGLLKWTLSPGDGVKYLAVYLVGANGRVSDPNAGGLLHTNLVSPTGRTLNTGERVQYRVNLDKNDLAIWNLVVFSGQADLYAWRPRFAVKPDYLSLGSLPGSGFDIVVSAFNVDESGEHILEVVATEGPLSYRLSPSGDVSAAGMALADTQAPPAAGGQSGFDRTALAAFDRPGSTPYELLKADKGTLRPTQSLAVVPSTPFTMTVPLQGALEELPPYFPYLVLLNLFLPLIAR